MMEIKQMKAKERTEVGGASWAPGDRLQKSLVYYFVGIGGCGMSGLARMLHRQGHVVLGSDAVRSAVTEQLSGEGIKVQLGHGVEGLPERVDCLVVSAAVKEDNAQWRWARDRGVRVCKYGQMLGELSRRVNTVAVAGTHGKSTSSGWLAYMLKQAGLDPSFVVGANVGQLAAGSGVGTGEYLVVEACEYDRSFLHLRPRVGAILNIEADHLDYYRDLEEIIGAFGSFAGLVASDGLLLGNGGDANVVRAASVWAGRCEWFGIVGKADWQAKRLTYDEGLGCFDLVYQGRRLGRVKLSLAGEHNVANALAVAAMGNEVGLSDEEICGGLEGFMGVSRRMSYKGTAGGVMIVDDYAHHPTEIRASLRALAARYRPGRLWCVFQPHQHSRTRFLLHEFALSFSSADVVLLPDIYFVRDSAAARREISARQLAEAIKAAGGAAYYLGDFAGILDYLCREVEAGDLVVTMGAGDVWKLADELISRLGRDC